MNIRPIDIARKLNISTSALRRYEKWGIVPPAERAANGYRMYTEEHVAYFECFRAMLPGFGMKITKEVLRKVQRKEVEDALWIVNQEQARLHQDKTMAEKTVRILENEELDKFELGGNRKWMTIGEVSAFTGASSSAIRHWEKEGLISLPRDQENGYRKFNRTQIRQIQMIRILRSANYPLEVIRQVLKEFGHNQIEVARRFARDSLDKLNYINRNQVRGIYYLYRLCSLLKLL
ncbi:MerR family transcriptional regulator [Thermoflavimicrobium dichotomicum]|uniref:DNA-binding transcriptional regulator, MerR family n=1 Tax=Thermoflavimicrobium dichotomicum TaxID=46223 RepID=A0A1I3T5X1_9BACL|nr:MerR family transcriptional regulator [Thermoflavimicrobium dichotomicum]SFJ66454.1 DNA-binding transcriptional regulator, MerR family [Thermoflavimicrobium dichotomicum]